jgi:hypothetical protein
MAQILGCKTVVATKQLASRAQGAIVHARFFVWAHPVVDERWLRSGLPVAHRVRSYTRRLL